MAGPFNFGNVVTRATINVDPHTARVIVDNDQPANDLRGCPVAPEERSGRGKPAQLPVQPDQLRSARNRIDTDLDFGSVGATQGLSSPFQVGNCSALAVQTVVQGLDQREDLETERREPAGQPHPGRPSGEYSRCSSQLPKQLPSRLTTLQKACPEATFAANPVDCRPLGSEVGTAIVATPVLPGKLTGRPTSSPTVGRRSPISTWCSKATAVTGDPDGQHENQEGDHELDVRRDPRRARLELRAEPARRPALGADGDTGASAQAAVDADDDHRAERRAGQQNTRISVSTAACGSSVTASSSTSSS